VHKRSKDAYKRFNYSIEVIKVDRLCDSLVILNVSSTASLMPGPLQAVYYATKAYVTFFSNAIAEELHDTNITVTALLLGATETEFARV